MTESALAWLVSTRVATDLAVLILVKASAWVGVVAVVAHLLRRRSAAVEHRVWAAGLVGLLVLPVGSTVSGSWGPAPFHYPSETALVGTAAIETASIPRPGAPLSVPPEPGQERASTSGARQAGAPAPTLHPATVALWVWWVGFTLFGVRSLTALVRATVLRRRSRPVAPEHRVARLARAVSAELGIGRPVSVVQARHPGVAATVGSLRPVVALGPDVVGLPDESLRAVVLHELAHVRRGDFATALLALLVTPLYWPNPLFWHLRRRASATLERACDDEVLSRGVHATTYARVLLGFAERRRSRAAVASLGILSLSPTRRRIEAVLDSARDRRGAPAASGLVAFVIVAAVTVPASSLRMLAYRPGTGPTPALVASLSHADAEVRRRAAATLGRRDPAPARQELERLLDDPVPEVRVAAASAVAGLADPASLPALRRVLARPYDGGRGEHGFVLKLAIVAAGRTDTAEGAALLEEQLDRPVAQLRWLALEELASMPSHGERALPHLERFARNDPDARNRRRAGELLDVVLARAT